jgi:hypothetical protein
MKVKEVATKLREEDLPVLEYLEYGCESEGEVKLTSNVSIQIGGHFCLTRRDGEDDLALEPLRNSVEEVIWDAKMWMKRPYP